MRQPRRHRQSFRVVVLLAALLIVVSIVSIFNVTGLYRAAGSLSPLQKALDESIHVIESTLNAIDTTRNATNTATGTATRISVAPTLIPLYLRTTEGTNWRLWNATRDGILFRDDMERENITCDWVTFIPATPLTHLPRPMVRDTLPICLYSGHSDLFVSETIRRTGRWHECDVLSSIVYDHGNELHVEIGANIGACLWQVLLTTNATIVAFEPAPSNLFVLTSTLLRLPMELRHRVWLFPIGLGDASLSSTIHVDANNRGNSIVGHTFGTATYLEPRPIAVERFDSIFDATQLTPRNVTHRRGGISSMKIDVQGFECGVVRGMLPTVLSTMVHIVLFENDDLLLSSSLSPCSPELLFALFTQSVDDGGANFVVHALDHHHLTIQTEPLYAAALDLQDLVAMPRQP